MSRYRFRKVRYAKELRDGRPSASATAGASLRDASLASSVTGAFLASAALRALADASTAGIAAATLTTTPG